MVDLADAVSNNIAEAISALENDKESKLASKVHNGYWVKFGYGKKNESVMTFGT